MSIAISLGWNCGSAGQGLELGLRKSKSGGYKTCPFDIMNTNYPGIIQCLKDDFKHFTDTEYLKLVHIPSTEKYHSNDVLIINTRYGFIFNHESPRHADLHIRENWPEGKDHFINNNFYHFIERYNRRIQNFRDYIHSGQGIIFLTNHPKRDYTKLIDCISTVYPHLSFSIQNVFKKDAYRLDLFVDIHIQMGLLKDDEEICLAKKDYITYL